MVHGLLVADTSAQEILVERAREISEGYFRGVTPASGVRVSVSGAGGTVSFTEDPKTPGVFRAALAPRPGERYQLRVEGREGQVATAETRIPSAPRLVVPTADTGVAELRPFPVVWTSAPGAGYVLVQRKIDQGAATDAVNLWGQAARSDTVVSWTLYWDVRVGVHLAVAAVDSNYLAYVGRTENGSAPAPASPLRTTVRGGYGIFGSLAYSNPRRVRVLR